MTLNLKDKVVIVVGAAGTIGSAVAKEFAKEGAKVVAADIRAAAEKSDYSAAQDCKNRLSIIAEKSAASKTGGARDELRRGGRKALQPVSVLPSVFKRKFAAPSADSAGGRFD